ncbi:DUF397 domain-containing protein [Sphaerisporangium sp. NPDC051017]|uniref:DUF397 domain-containing protein n=1 Tax=Sphaerisporangium sp. NPDC051017 TaxID=3154636 RepID=UPI00341F2CC8
MSSLVWYKSSYSAANDNCVEVADLPGAGRAVRDSKRANGPTIICTSREWQAFISGMKADRWDWDQRELDCYRLVPTDATPIPLAAEIDALEA